MMKRTPLYWIGLSLTMVGMLIVAFAVYGMIAAYRAGVGHDTAALVDEVRAAMRPAYLGIPIFLVGQLIHSIFRWRRRRRRSADNKENADSEE